MINVSTTSRPVTFTSYDGWIIKMFPTRRFLFASFDVNCIVHNSCKIEQKVPVVLDNSYSGEEVPLSPKFGVLTGAPCMSGCWCFG